MHNTIPILPLRERKKIDFHLRWWQKSKQEEAPKINLEKPFWVMAHTEKLKHYDNDASGHLDLIYLHLVPEHMEEDCLCTCT